MDNEHAKQHGSEARGRGPLRFRRIPNPGLRANWAISLAVVGLVIGLLLAAAFVDQGFALLAMMVIFCFGRYLFTGSCPGVQLIGKIRGVFRHRT